MSSRLAHRTARIGLASALLAVLATAAWLAFSGPAPARADTWIACYQPTVAGPVVAADGRVYFRGTANCNGAYRLRMLMKVNTVLNNVNGPDAFNGGVGGLGVFSVGRCSSGNLYQGVAVVSVLSNGAWQDITSGTSGPPHRAC